MQWEITENMVDGPQFTDGLSHSLFVHVSKDVHNAFRLHPKDSSVIHPSIFG